MMDVFHAVLLMALATAVFGWWYERLRRIDADDTAKFWDRCSMTWREMAVDAKRELGDLLEYKGAARDYSLLQKKRAKQK